MDPVGVLTAGSAWVAVLPKVELHLHLEGAIRAETVRDLSVERLGWSGPLPSNWHQAYYTYTDFAGFMAQLTPRFPARPDEYARIAAECFEDLAALQVVYAEVSFGVPSATPGDDLRFWPIMEALEVERRRAEARWPIRLNFIAALQRAQPPDVGLWSVELAARARDRGIGVVGIDLHGDEQRYPAAPFVAAYHLARERGLAVRAHAGEAAGPESVRDALELLGVKRIGHGVRAVEDPALLERFRQGDVTLEMCPTSNVRTAVVPHLRAHPIRRFFELGIPVTVNSDDPLPFFTDIERESRLLVDELGFSHDELRRITLTAARAAFLPEPERQALVSLIDGAYRTADRPIAEPAVSEPTGRPPV